MGCQGVVATDLGHGHADQFDGLGRGLLAVVMDPGAVLADVGHFDQVGIQPFHGGRLAEGAQVHVRRAGGHDHAGELFRGDLLADERLARFGAHVFVGHRAGHARQLGDRGGRPLDIDGAGDVLAAPTDKYADSAMTSAA